jgi:soluble lytic murein transglycosylase-like protein
VSTGLQRASVAWVAWVVRLALAFAFATLAAPSARAVCVFFDGAGVAHLAATALDSRFTCWRSAGAAQPTQERRVPGKTDDLRSLLLGMELSATHAWLKPALKQAAEESGVDVELLRSVIAVESGFDTSARSPRGALGLMQITPVTAQRYARGAERQIDLEALLLDPKANIRIGARMLADLTRRYGRMDAALAAWNAGEGRVRRSGGVPDIAETRAHVHLVLELYWVLLQERQARRATQFRLYPPTAQPSPAADELPSMRVAQALPDAALPPALAAASPAAAPRSRPLLDLGLGALAWVPASSRLSPRQID